MILDLQVALMALSSQALFSPWPGLIVLFSGLDGFLAIEKYMMKRQGLFTTDVRRNPIEWKMDLETQQELERLLMLIDL